MSSSGSSPSATSPRTRTPTARSGRRSNRSAKPRRTTKQRSTQDPTAGFGPPFVVSAPSARQCRGMPSRAATVQPGVKSLFSSALALLVCAPLFAADVDPKIDRAVRDAPPICHDAKVTYGDLQVKLPPRFTGTVARVESATHTCDTQLAVVVSPAGNIFIGAPWPIADEE